MMFRIEFGNRIVRLDADKMVPYKNRTVLKKNRRIVGVFPVNGCIVYLED